MGELDSCGLGELKSMISEHTTMAGEGGSGEYVKVKLGTGGYMNANGRCKSVRVVESGKIWRDTNWSLIWMRSFCAFSLSFTGPIGARRARDFAK